MQYTGQHSFPQWANPQNVVYQPIAMGPLPSEKYGFNAQGEGYNQQSSGYVYDPVPVQNFPGYTYDAAQPTFHPPRYSIPPPPPTPPPPPKQGPHGFFSGGWRSGVSYSAIAIFGVFLINVGLTSWANSKYGNVGGLGIISEGNCADIKKYSLWIHLVINGLSTVLLSASNYTTQCLSAPTRAEVDRAHARRRWLDIGIPSLRNLGKISWGRLILWWLLILSSVPLHFIYNSAVFSTLETNTYKSMAISEGALTQFLTNKTDIESFYSDPRNFENIDKTACMKAYGKQILPGRRDVIVVTNGTAGVSNTAVNGLASTGTNTGRQPFDWICETAGTDTSKSCDINDALALVSTWEINGGYVQYCLSEEVPERCNLGYSLHIMIIVIVCNAIKVICMLLAVFNSRNSDDPLVTIGDAVASFLGTEDITTTGMCIVSKREIKQGAWGPVVAAGTNRPEQPRLWKSQRPSWFRAASIWRWLVCIILAVIGIFVVLIVLFLCLSVWNDTNVPHDLRSLWNMGFGSVNINALASPPMGRTTSYQSLIANVLIANTPQAVFSFLYLLYNSIFTSMLLADEWDRFSTERRPLRVTTPIGSQRSTYFLHLPYKYSIPLMVGSGIMHWFISQSIFLARILEFDGDQETSFSMTTTGYSPIAIIFAILLGGIMLLTVLVLGFRRYSGGMPLVGSCSAAISAACHTGEWGVALMPVKWGAVGTGGPVGHCTFSGEEVQKLVPGRWYAGKVKRREKCER